MLVSSSAASFSWKPRVGAELIGRQAPEFSPELQWLNSKPITLASLRGKVVFLRFWMGDCSMCRATIPTLRYLQRTYEGRGLVVLGIEYNSGLPSDKIKRITEQESMKFPVAIDSGDKTVRAYWWNQDRSDPDSRHGWWGPSFLIDKQGRIRWVHEGGALLMTGERKSQAFEDLKKLLDTVLEEKVASPTKEGVAR